MKTLFYTLIILLSVSCSKSETEDIYAARLNNFDIKGIEWKRYDALQLCKLKLIDDTLFLFSRVDYSNIGTPNEAYFTAKQSGRYVIKNDSLILHYDKFDQCDTHIRKRDLAIERYLYMANSDSLNFLNNKTIIQTYYSKNKHGAY
jgi:hypothetical protein